MTLRHIPCCMSFWYSRQILLHSIARWLIHTVLWLLLPLSFWGSHGFFPLSLVLRISSTGRAYDRPVAWSFARGLWYGNQSLSLHRIR